MFSYNNLVSGYECSYSLYLQGSTQEPDTLKETKILTSAVTTDVVKAIKRLETLPFGHQIEINPRGADLDAIIQLVNRRAKRHRKVFGVLPALMHDGRVSLSKMSPILMCEDKYGFAALAADGDRLEFNVPKHTHPAIRTAAYKYAKKAGFSVTTHSDKKWLFTVTRVSKDFSPGITGRHISISDGVTRRYKYPFDHLTESGDHFFVPIEEGVDAQMIRSSANYHGLKNLRSYRVLSEKDPRTGDLIGFRVIMR